MRAFDIVGAIVVAGWLVFGGLYVYRAETEEAARGESSASMREGKTWLNLRRGDEDVGYLHRAYTELEDGWLAEYEFAAIVEIEGEERVVDSDLRARLDEEAAIVTFDGSFETADGRIVRRGEVADGRLNMQSQIDDGVREASFELGGPARLASSAYERLLSDDAGGDEKIEGRFVDPVTASFSKMLFIYDGQTTVDVFESTKSAHQFAREIGEMRHDVYVDRRGEYLIHEFPTRAVGTRLPDRLVDSRVAAVRRELDERRKEAEEAAEESSDIDVVDVAGAFGATFQSDEPTNDDTDRNSE